MYSANGVRFVHRFVESNQFGNRKVRPGEIGNGRLEATIGRVHNWVDYNNVDDPIRIATYYGYALIVGHAFIDGNKRTGFVTMVSILSMSGYDISCTFEESEAIVIECADRKIEFEDLYAFYSSNVQKRSFLKSLKYWIS